VDGGTFKWEGDRLQCFPPWPIGLLIGAVLSAALWADSIPYALAQSPSGRLGALAVNAGVNDPEPAKRTVESASRDAQKAINACGDDVALQCVAVEICRCLAADRLGAEPGIAGRSAKPPRRMPVQASQAPPMPAMKSRPAGRFVIKIVRGDFERSVLSRFSVTKNLVFPSLHRRLTDV
jgi:hypothetical protein